MYTRFDRMYDLLLSDQIPPFIKRRTNPYRGVLISSVKQYIKFFIYYFSVPYLVPKSLELPASME